MIDKDNNTTTSQTENQPIGIIFACDESGAKGYADRDEAYPGEIGVFAGILMPEFEKASKLPAFQALVQKYKPENGKLHIADLESHIQESLRNDVFTTIKDSNLPCFWYAIHVAGFHEHYKKFVQIDDTEALASKPRFKMSGNKPMPGSLHVALFEGLYGHLIAFCEEQIGSDVNIEIRSDKVDQPIIKQFIKAASSLLDKEPVTHKIKAFDIDTQQVVERTMNISIDIPDSYRIDTEVSHMNISVTDDDDRLVLAADVLVNSLFYLFKNRNPDELFGYLNSVEAIINHPLADSLNSFQDWGNGDLIGDGLYRHPKRKIS